MFPGMTNLVDAMASINMVGASALYAPSSALCLMFECRARRHVHLRHTLTSLTRATHVCKQVPLQDIAKRDLNLINEVPIVARRHSIGAIGDNLVKAVRPMATKQVLAAAPDEKPDQLECPEDPESHRGDSQREREQLLEKSTMGPIIESHAVSPPKLKKRHTLASSSISTELHIYELNELQLQMQDMWSKRKAARTPAYRPDRDTPIILDSQADVEVEGPIGKMDDGEKITSNTEQPLSPPDELKAPPMKPVAEPRDLAPSTPGLTRFTSVRSAGYDLNYVRYLTECQFVQQQLLQQQQQQAQEAQTQYNQWAQMQAYPPRAYPQSIQLPMQWQQPSPQMYATSLSLPDASAAYGYCGGYGLGYTSHWSTPASPVMVMSHPSEPRPMPLPLPMASSVDQSWRSDGWDAHVLAPSLVSLAMEKEGSQLLQAQLQLMGPDQLRAVVEVLAPSLPELATHTYGNYLVSSLAQIPSAHAHVTAALSGRVVWLMQHPQGCRVVQRALERLPYDAVRSLVAELRGKVAEVASDKEGKYSVLIALKHARQPWIMREIAAALSTLCVTRNGSLFLQRLLDPQHRLLPMPTSGPGSHAVSAPDELDHACDVRPVLDALVGFGQARLEALAADQYANFVVKLGLLDRRHRGNLCALLLPRLAPLSVTKWGSHVAKVVVGIASKSQLIQAKLALHDPELRSHAYASFVIVALDRACMASGIPR